MKLIPNSIKSYIGPAILMTLLIGTICSPGKLFLSDATNEVYIGVCGQNAVSFENLEWTTNNTPIRYDDKLTFMTFCRTGAIEVLYPINKSIFIKFQMQDATGKEVTKTTEGQHWGSDLQHFPSKPGLNVHDRMGHCGATGSHTNGFSALGSGPSLPSPKDLFEMRDSGIYDLTMEVHLTKQHMLGTTNWTWDHIVIPPVTVKVEKPPSKN